MAEKVTLESLRSDIKEGFSEVRGDIRSIHEDLIKHDERAEKMMEMMQRLLVIDELKTKVNRIRDFLHEKHGVEI